MAVLTKPKVKMEPVRGDGCTHSKQSEDSQVGQTAKPRQNEETEQEARSQSESGMVTGRPQKSTEERKYVEPRENCPQTHMGGDGYMHVHTWIYVCIYGLIKY